MAASATGSDEFINFKCCLCEKKNITKEADTYCVECQDYYCSSCTDLHKMFPSAVGVHQFIDKSSFNTAGLQKTLPSFPVERCAVHSHKLLDMYCADHDDIACMTCIAINHRTCQHIHSVPDEVDNLHKKTNIDGTSKDLLDMTAKMEEIKKAKEMLVAMLQEQKVKAAESIKEFRREMEEVLDTLENESIRNLEEKHKTLKERLENDINRLQKHIDKLKLSAQKLAKSSGNRAQQFVSVKITETNLTEAKKDETTLVNASILNVEFTADSKIKETLKDFKAFGSISVNETCRMRNKLYEVKTKKRVNIKHQNIRSTCNVQGSCFTDGGLLLLTDLNNKDLKLVDVSSESVKDQLQLEVSPLAVCLLGKNEIAVALNNNTIQIISLENGLLKIIKQLKLDHYCFSLAYKDRKLYVSDQSKSLYIYNLNGNLIRKITTDNQGNEIFSGNRHISVSSDGKMIYVADFKKGLIVLDLNGNYRKTITDPDFVNLWGVCTDKQGNIFVNGWGYSKLVQINEKSGVKLGVLGNVTYSRSTCYDPQHNKLVVTSFNSDFIEVYNLV